MALGPKITAVSDGSLPRRLQDSARRFNAGNIQSVVGCRWSAVRGKKRFAKATGSWQLATVHGCDRSGMTGRIFDDEYRTRRILDNSFSRATEQQTFETPITVGTDHNEIGTHLLGLGHNLFV